MGCYDYVNVWVKCPKCGTEVSGFQTKNGDSLFLPVDLDNILTCYSSCPECGENIELVRKAANVPQDFIVKVGINNCEEFELKDYLSGF